MKPNRISDAALRRKIHRKVFNAQGSKQFGDLERWIFKEICAASTRGYLVGRQPGGVLKKGEEV